MFDSPGSNSTARQTYKFGIISENGSQYFSITIIEITEVAHHYSFHVYVPEEQGADGGPMICVSVKRNDCNELTGETESVDFFDATMSVQEFKDFYIHLKKGKPFDLHGQVITFKEELTVSFKHVLDFLFAISPELDLSYFPVFKRKEVQEATEKTVFHRKMTHEETLSLLEDMNGRTSYEFFEEDYRIDHLNVQKILFMLGRLVDVHSTDGEIGNYSFDEVRKELKRLDRKYRNGPAW